jgi:hypothetical protein
MSPSPYNKVGNFGKLCLVDRVRGRKGARHATRQMSERGVFQGTHIRLDPQTRRLMLVDHDGKPVPAAQRRAYIDNMTRDQLRALVEALFDLQLS